jgi:hypothetical protein
MVKEGAGEFTQEVLIFFLNFARNYAYLLAGQEAAVGLQAGQLTLNLINGTVPQAGAISVDVAVGDTVVHSSVSSVTTNPAWNQNWTFDVRNLLSNSVTVTFKVLDQTRGIVLGVGSIGGDEPNTLDFSGKVVNVSVPIPAGSADPSLVSGPGSTLNVSYQFVPWWNSNVPGRGFIYSPELPVLSPDVELPIGAQPSHSFTVQDDMMKEAMAAIVVFWRTFGQDAAMNVIPQRLPKRIDWANTDAYFANRRMNGYNPQFWTKNKNKSPQKPWDYSIDWDFSYLNPNPDGLHDINKGVLWPEQISANFVLVQDGTAISPHSISWVQDGTSYFQLNDNTPAWENAKTLYLYVEVNLVFNWSHVGVHFDVEQYAMALYRNLTPSNPLWGFLTPHFADIIYNDREVIRPTPNGAVSVAGALTFSGQMKMVAERFKGFTFKWTPPRVVPDTVVDDVFDRVSDGFWSVITTYVQNWIKENQATLQQPDNWKQIQAMSGDLQGHALNPDAGSMTIKDLNDLAAMCSYCIYQAIFYHDWVHWNSWDDFHQSVYFRKDAESVYGINAEKQASTIDTSNMTQAFITYTSPTLRQWPVLDPLLGGPAALKNALFAKAAQLNQQLLLGTYIMAPNT